MTKKEKGADGILSDGVENGTSKYGNPNGCKMTIESWINEGTRAQGNAAE